MNSEESRKLLLVEDDAFIAMAEQHELETHGYDVVVAPTGEEAIRVVREGGDFDLILMDINLGKGLDGTEAAEIILKDTDIPIVFLSSHMEREVVEKTEKITSYGYVVKNSNITILDASIKMAFRLFEEKKARLRKEKELEESEHQLRSITGNVQDAIFAKDSDRKYTFVNPAAAILIGYPAHEIIGKTPEDLFNSAEAEKIRGVDDQNLRGSTVSKVEKMVIGDRLLYLHTSQNPVFSDQGEIIGITGIVRDITSSKEAEQRIASLLAEKELLLREAHHRIKNNMGTVQSLILLQGRAFTDPHVVSAFRDTVNRVQSMMILYEKLLESSDLEEISVRSYFSELIDETVLTFPNHRSVVIDKQIDDFRMKDRRLIPLGIIINEIITNAMNHAFTSTRNPRLDISASIRSGNAVIVIGDNGSGIPDSVDFTQTTSFGLRIIRALAMQIDAKVRLDRDNGTRFTIEFGIPFEG